MARLIVISNRLPIAAIKREGVLSFQPSVGGLATGLASFYRDFESLWVGWPGLPSEQFKGDEREQTLQRLHRDHCYPVFLTQHQVQYYYYGFSNKVIWPLFHYFPTYATFDQRFWQAYLRANEAFCAVVVEIARPDDILWIHDYHLMLLPQMVRRVMPQATIGFFLHIPFPSYEIFRLLPWRREILEGLLGADLIGFHTYDYTHHFLSSVRHIMGYDHAMGMIHVEDRVVKVDAFPMGIDYERFATAIRDLRVREEIERIRARVGDRKVILSIDRLDYTKGIPQRLEVFDRFLEKYPEYREKVTLILVAVPSRIEIEQYRSLKQQVEMLVGRINGKYGTIGWVPVWYLCQFMPFHALVSLYRVADVALVTPLRDGMNLIAKEYLATRTDGHGVLILSEMAGAAQELGEALIVNPYNQEELVDALHAALHMSLREQRERNRIMRERLQRYNVVQWARDFMDRLHQVRAFQRALYARLLTEEIRRRLLTDYRRASRRLLFLDYDGTLVPFADRPERARVDRSLLQILRRLAADDHNEVVVISGRDRTTLERWMGALPLNLVAEHGVWIRERGRPWQLIEPLRNDWKDEIRPLLELFAARTPGAFVEEKEYSLVWHYRKADPRIAEARARELKDTLLNLTSNLGIGILEGNRVIEVKNTGVHKGRAVLHWLAQRDWDFILAIGDDRTDEDVFEVLPDTAYSIRVGVMASKARFSVRSYMDVRRLLQSLVRIAGSAKR